MPQNKDEMKANSLSEQGLAILSKAGANSYSSALLRWEGFSGREETCLSYLRTRGDFAIWAKSDCSAGRNAARPAPPASGICPVASDGSLREAKAEDHEAGLPNHCLTHPYSPEEHTMWKPFSSKGLELF